MTVNFRRVIRSKGSNVARLMGETHTVADLAELIAHAKRTKKVYAFVDSAGNEGTIRSGRKMRRVDSHVRNTLTVGDGIQRSLPIVVEEVKAVEVDPFGTPDMIEAYSILKAASDRFKRQWFLP